MSWVGASRKRARLGESAGHSAASSVSGSAQRVGTSAMNSVVTSPTPFVNTRYRLAGGLDTPTAAAPAVTHEKEHRTYGTPQETPRRYLVRAGTKRRMEDDDYDDYGYPSYTPDALARERNGRGRGGTSATPSGSERGWGRTMMEVVGNVAGKVWQFCRSSAFRGFYAGGGPGYEWNGAQGVQGGSRRPNAHEADGLAQRSSHDVRQTTPVRTRFSDESSTEGHYAREDTPPRPAKRIQREEGRGELRGHWVMVSPKGAPSGHAHSTSSLGRTARVSEADRLGRKLGTPQKRLGASRVGRKSGLSPSKPSSVSHAGSPGLHAKRPASFASPRSPASPTKDTTFMPTEAQRLAARRRRQDKEADASIQRFNQQLKAMIREGKEALGTRFEVDEEPDGMEVEEGEEVDEEGLGTEATVEYLP